MSARHPSLAALARLIAQCFTAAQLRDLLAREHGARLLRQLPEDTEDATLLAHAALTALASESSAELTSFRRAVLCPYCSARLRTSRSSLATELSSSTAPCSVSVYSVITSPLWLGAPHLPSSASR